VYGRLVAVATSDRDAWEADQVEFDTEAGPCVQALREGEYNSIKDLSLETRWPTWTAVAGVLGFRSALGIPAEIPPDGHLIALNAYGRGLDAFAGDPQRRCELYVAEIARALPSAMRVFDQAGLIADLQAALVSRSTIDQAIGVLMGQNRCTSDEAFGILRRASQNANVKLRDVAAAIIQRYTGQPLPAPPPFDARRPPGQGRT
jgi:hypothetical protein